MFYCLVVVQQTNSENSSEGDDHNIDPNVDADIEMQDTTQPIAKRGRKKWITPRLTAALDAGKVTDAKAVHILIAAAEALGVDVSELIINHTSLYELRRKYRKLEMEKNQEELINNVI